MPFEPLAPALPADIPEISREEMRRRLHDPSLILVDVLPHDTYAAGHIPGAIGFNWQSQLQDQVKRDIIGKEAFEKLVGSAGISPSGCFWYC